MARYFVESPHTNAECLQALDEMAAGGRELIAKFDFDCKSPTHTCWGTLEGANPEAVRNLLPPSVRSKARIVEVVKYTPEQIKSFHTMKA